MAASLQKVSLLVSRVSNALTKCVGCSRLSQFYSTSSGEDGDQNTRVPLVGLSSDGGTVLSWHPEPAHPYECTKPLPRKESHAQEGDSVLKVQVVREEQLKYRPGGPTPHELANLTYTTKHRWFPKPEKKYRKRHSPKDREGL